FERNRPLRAFGFGNQPLADLVISIFLKASLAASKLAQTPFGRLRCDRLECLTTCLIPLAAAFDVLARKRFTVAVGCQSDDPQIDAQDTFDIDRFGRFNLAAYKQIPLATDQREIGFTALGGKQFALAFATDERDRLPPVQCPDRNRGTVQ